MFLTLTEGLVWGERREPPDAFRDFLLTLHHLCSNDRVNAIGCLSDQPYEGPVPIPASDWVDLYFDSDGEKLRNTGLFSRLLLFHHPVCLSFLDTADRDQIQKFREAGR
jgi:hypothetical protein